MTMNEKNDTQSPTPQSDQWSALLSDLGIEQPVETPSEASPSKQTETEPVVAKEFNADTDSSQRTNERDSASHGSARDRTEEAEKGNFFDKFPQIDFLGSSTREKVDLAVSGFTETILPAVRDTLQNTIDALSSQRLGKAESKDTVRTEPPKEKQRPAKASSRRSDPWSSLASQLGVLAGFSPDDGEEMEDAPEIVDSDEKSPGAVSSKDETATKASEPSYSRKRTNSLAEQEVAESATSEARHAEPRNEDSRRSRRGGRDRRNRKSFWDNEKGEEIPAAAEDVEAVSDSFSGREAATGRHFRDTDSPTPSEPTRSKPTQSEPTRPERDRRQSRRSRNSFFEDEPDQKPLFEEPIAEREEKAEGDSGFSSDRRGRRRRTPDRSKHEEENAEVDRRAAAALRESGIDFEPPRREDNVGSGRRSGRNRSSKNFAEETDNGFAVDEAAWVAEDETQPIERRRGRRSRSSRREESFRESESRDEAADSADMAQLHRGFPDWEEAVSTVIEVNVARRSQRQSGRGKR